MHDVRNRDEICKKSWCGSSEARGDSYYFILISGFYSRFVVPGLSSRNKCRDRYTLFSREDVHTRAAIIREIRDNKRGNWSPLDFDVLNFEMAEVRRTYIGRDTVDKTKKKGKKEIASILRAPVARIPANKFPDLMRALT